MRPLFSKHLGEFEKTVNIIKTTKIKKILRIFLVQIIFQLTIKECQKLTVSKKVLWLVDGVPFAIFLETFSKGEAVLFAMLSFLLRVPLTEDRPEPRREPGRKKKYKS